MDHYLTEHHINDVYVMAPNYAAGHDMIFGFKRTFKSKIVGEVYTTFGQIDCQAELTRIRAAKPKAVFVFYSGGKGHPVHQATGSLLSGGEQQMLAIGRAPMINPQFVILDEATEGLAPLIREEIWRVPTELKAAGPSILIAEKDVKALSRIADRHYVLEMGCIIWSGSFAELRAHPELQNHLGA